MHLNSVLHGCCMHVLANSAQFFSQLQALAVTKEDSVVNVLMFSYYGPFFSESDQNLTHVKYRFLCIGFQGDLNSVDTDSLLSNL